MLLPIAAGDLDAAGSQPSLRTASGAAQATG